MKRAFSILFLLACLGAQGQGDLSAFLSTTKSSFEEQSKDSDKLHSFLDGIPSSQSDARQLHTLFRRMHKVFLKNYKAYSDFDELFTSGKYDCLTATALFSNVLDNFQYAYEIIETNYHIFLMVKTSKGEIMIETTDRRVSNCFFMEYILCLQE